MTLSEKFYLYCLQFVGLPYFWGGDDPMEGFDCSGLVQELYHYLGMAPRRDCTALYLYNFFKNDSYIGVKKLGALAFYGKSMSEISHVAMFLDDIRIIEAGGGNAMTISREKASAQNAFIRVRAFDRREDLLTILTPKQLPF